jgi:dUTP pyrophosphatase
MCPQLYNNMPNLLIKKLSPTAQVLKRGSDFAAGYDLFTEDMYELRPGERHLYGTGLAMAIPSGLYGRIAPRSGLAFKKGIDVLAGVIDEDYRQEVGVLLINLGDTPWKPELDQDGKVKAIAQIIFEYYTEVALVESDSLPKSTRKGGFGSTDATPPSASSISPTPSLAAIKQEIPIQQGRPSLTSLYERSGGIPVRTPYSEEMKAKNG